MIKNIKLFINNNEKSFETAKIVRKKLETNDFKFVKDDFDLGIAIGGDGAFLRMLHQTNFDGKPFYVGVNSGTLGFLQEVEISELDKLIYELQNEKFIYDNIGVQESTIYHDDELSTFYSLNEIIAKSQGIKMSKFNIEIDDSLLEKFAGDGILVATSQGSTAHNVSYGGSIVYPEFSTLQITPMGTATSSVYNSLRNSVIVPSNKIISLSPIGERKNLTIAIDGEEKNYQRVDKINTTIKDKKIKSLRFSDYRVPEKINSKLL